MYTYTLWPGYIHWARGNLHLATEAFAAEIDELNGNCIHVQCIYNDC